ncbi:unnamed protein product, partial [Mesorhabditis spiculigera]
MDIMKRLTEADKEILRRSWAIVSKEKEPLACNIFQMIFELAPDAKLMFSFMINERKDDPAKSKSEFAFHALRFLQIIESTILYLETPEELDGLLLNLGKLHARHEEQLGFRPHYWGVFKECTLFHFRKAIRADRKTNKKGMDSRETDSAIILWREILTDIVDRMIVGLAANGLIRKANKDMREHRDSQDGSASASTISGHHDKSIKQICHSLRRAELSVIVPEYFMRRKSDAPSLNEDSI